MTTHELPGDERLAQLRRAAESLPREIEPATDAWPAIKARVEAARVVPLSGAAWRPAHRASRPWRIVAAAAVLVVASSALTMVAMRGRNSAPARSGEGAAATSGVVLVAASERRQLVTAVCRDYDAAAGDLERALRTRRGQLSPATMRVLDESLRTIDQAIGEARAALEKDPASQDMLDLLDSVYRQKLDLLRRANALPLRSS